MEEHIIIQNCLKNDRVSQSKLYNLYHKVMMGVCLRYCKEVFMAEEALQNGFIKMFLSLNSYDQSRPFAPWFRRIIINSCLDQLTKHKISIQIEEAHFEDRDYIEYPETDLTHQEVMKIVQNMPAGYRTVFNMYIIDDMSHQEIAQSLHINEATSRSQLFKARNYIRTTLINQKKISL